MTETISWMVKREHPTKRPKVNGLILRWFLAGGLVGGTLAGVIVAGVARVIYVTRVSHFCEPVVAGWRAGGCRGRTEREGLLRR